MNIEKVSGWFQVVGIIAVVASLVVVGMQLKQSHEIAIASEYQARLDSASSHYTAILQSEHSLRVMGKTVLADIMENNELPAQFKEWASNQPVEELAFRVIGAIIFLKSHDNVYFQYQAGFLSQEAWDALRAQLKADLNDSRTWTRSVFESDIDIWRESYRNLIQELINEGPASKQQPLLNLGCTSGMVIPPNDLTPGTRKQRTT